MLRRDVFFWFYKENLVLIFLYETNIFPCGAFVWIIFTLFIFMPFYGIRCERRTTVIYESLAFSFQSHFCPFLINSFICMLYIQIKDLIIKDLMIVWMYILVEIVFEYVNKHKHSMSLELFVPCVMRPETLLYIFTRTCALSFTIKLYYRYCRKRICNK